MKSYSLLAFTLILLAPYDVLAGRKLVSQPISFAAFLRPGPALDDLVGYIPSGPWYSSGKTPETEYFGRQIRVTLTNISTITQSVRVNLEVSGISWGVSGHYPMVTLVGANTVSVAGGPPPVTTTLATESEAGSVSILSGQSRVFSFKVKFHGPAHVYTALWTAQASIGAVIAVTEDRGALTGAVNSHTIYSTGGPNGVFGGNTDVDLAFVAASQGSSETPLNGGRPF